MRIDPHTHSTVSDGTDSPSELMGRAVAAGLDVVVLTDHDTFDGLAEAQSAAASLGLGLVTGVEMSADVRGVSVHLLGYGCDANDVALRDELERIRQGRDARVPAMLGKLADLGMPLTMGDLLAEVAGSPSIGRPHVADALVAKGYVHSRDEAFATFLADGGAAFVPRYGVPLDRGVDLIHGAGGVAVIAHPWGRVSQAGLTGDVLGHLVRDHGLDGVEVDHGDHDAATRAELRALAASLGLLATGGSDYHGGGKAGHELGSETTGPAIWAEIERRAGA